MLKGIANVGDGNTPEDRYGIVLALSQLSERLTEAEADSAFFTAAETAAALLRVRTVAVFVTSGSGLAIGGSAGLDGQASLEELCREAAHIVLTSGIPLIYPQTSGEPFPLAVMLDETQAAAMMSVPMRIGDTSVGAVVAISTQPRIFTPVDVELLHVVASHAALAAWRSNSEETPLISGSGGQEELIRHAQRKIRELSLLNQVSEAMNSTLELEVLLDIALKQSLAVVGADAGSLMLVNEETNRLEIVASRGLHKKWVEKTSLEVGKSIAGWVAEHGESVLVTDANKDRRFDMPFVRKSITCSAALPLKVKGNVIGVLNVNTVQLDKAFDERDIELLTTVANQMAVTIENARLYARVNRRTKQLDSLLHISRTVTSTLNQDEVFRRLAEEILALFQIDVCVLLVLDELSDRFWFGYGTGLKTRRKYVYYDLAVPIAQRVKTTGRRLAIHDINASQSLRSDVSKSEGIGAAICIPLKSEGKLVGVAAGFAREPRNFPKSQRDIMRPLGELAGVAIRNARVYRKKYRIAELLQHRLIPSSIPQIDGLDIGHNFMPAREVGGDYYDFISTGKDSVGIVVADVSGSDVEAAEYTTMGKHVLRTYAREFASPAKVLTKTNNLICEDTTAEVFISLFYGVMDTKKMKLSYANAGCEPPVLYQAKTGRATTLTAEGILLGIRSGFEFEEREVKLVSGDVVALYTDGLTEASVDGRRLGRQAIKDIVAANAHLGGQQIADAIRDALLKYVHGRITDDVAMVVLKVL